MKLPCHKEGSQNNEVDLSAVKQIQIKRSERNNYYLTSIIDFSDLEPIVDAQERITLTQNQTIIGCSLHTIESYGKGTRGIQFKLMEIPSESTEQI